MATPPSLGGGSPRRVAPVGLDLVAVGSCVVLVERQHLQRAAPRLQVTPSALTKSVQLLER
jgi:uncharacterized OsmC-like protein